MYILTGAETSPIPTASAVNAAFSTSNGATIETLNCVLSNPYTICSDCREKVKCRYPCRRAHDAARTKGPALPAMKNDRSRMHGEKAPARAIWKHGTYS